MVAVGQVSGVEVREFLFQMFDVLEVGAVLTWPRYRQHSDASLQQIVETFSHLATGRGEFDAEQTDVLVPGSVGVVPEPILALGNGLYQAGGQRHGLFRTLSEDTLEQGTAAILTIWQALRHVLAAMEPGRLNAPESADLRDRLLNAKVRTEGGLAMVLQGALLADQASNHPDESQRQYSQRLLGFLEPILAWWPLHAARQASLSLCQDVVPMPEPARGSDLARELLGQRVWANQSHGLQIFLQTLQRDLEAADTEDTRQWALSLSETLQHAVKVTQTLGKELQEGSSQRVLANARRYLNLFGEIVAGWMWLRQANAATRLTAASSGLQDFRAGKLQAARYFFHRALPAVAQDLVLLQNQDSTSFDMQATWY